MPKRKKKTKYCYACKKRRRIKNFGFNKFKSDGYKQECKDCERQYRNTHRTEINARNRKYRRTPNAKFSDAKREANKRGINWDLSKEEYFELMENKCYYGGCELPEAGIGLDRINNDKSIGYIKDNVVPCCKRHNLMRGDWVDFDIFKAMCDLEKKLMKKKKRA